MLVVQLLLRFQKITQDNMQENSFFSSEFLNKKNRIIDGEVNTYADLPASANHNGEIWIVKTTTGVIFVNKKVAGLYVSNGTTWTIITPVEIDGYQKLITTPTNDNIAITDVNGQTKDGGKKISDLVDKITGKGLSTNDYTDTEKTKLAGIATGATANSTDAYLLSRANHTGSQATSTITGLDASLSSKEVSANKDASNGYAGLTLFKINFRNVANTLTSFFTNSNTTSRTYTFPDVDGTVITTGDTGTITSSMIASGAIVNNDINATANISATKLRQETISQTKTQPANNDTLNVVVNKLLGLNNTGSSLAPLTIANLASGGVIGTAAATVDINNKFLINQSTDEQTITFPNPTNPTLGQSITVKANSVVGFSCYGEFIARGNSANFFWSGSSWCSQASTASYMTGYNAPTYTTNVAAGDHIKFNAVYNFGGDNILLDTSTTYTTALNQDSIGRITLKAGKTYKLWGSLNNANATGVVYGAFRWVNADTGASISLISSGGPPQSTTDRLPGVGAVCYFTSTIDTRVELQLLYSLNTVYGSSTGAGPAQFHIETI